MDLIFVTSVIRRRKGILSHDGTIMGSRNWIHGKDGMDEGASKRIARCWVSDCFALEGPLFCKSFDECGLDLIGPKWADYSRKCGEMMKGT